MGGFWACGPRSPPEGPKQRRRERERKATGTPEAAEPESQKQQSQRAREEAQGSATDGLFLYIGAPFPARGARREAEIGAGALVVCSLGGFWACGPRQRAPSREGERGKGRQRGRQKQQSQRAREEAQGSATDGLCLYIGAPFPARGARREADWSRRVGCLYFGWLLGLRAPVPARGPQAEKEEKEREGKEGNGDARSSRAREPERKPKGVQQTGFAYI